MPQSKSGGDFYTLLGISRADVSNAETLKSCYKKAAMRTHPDRKGGDAETFKRVARAYEVLSDSNLRSIYDEYGEEGLKQGFQPPQRGAAEPSGGGFSQGFNTHTANGSGGFAHEMSGEDAERMFRSFFGGGGGIFGADFGGVGGGEAFDMMGASPRGGSDRKRGRGESVLNLECSLEELFSGVRKEFKIKRQVNGPNGLGMIDKDEQFTVDIKPGWKDGTRIKYDRKGNEIAGQGPGSATDLVIVVKEKPHRWFKREGDDLVYTIPSISLRSALVGFKLKIPGLDGEQIDVSFEDACTNAGDTRVISGKGMPNQKTGARGSIRVKVEKIVFPKTLTAKQKTMIKQAFA